MTFAYSVTEGVHLTLPCLALGFGGIENSICLRVEGEIASLLCFSGSAY